MVNSVNIFSVSEAISQGSGVAILNKHQFSPYTSLDVRGRES